ncbi:GntR family transcriptional regulator [Dactylosporangium vinaceum]|uniref:GntR family transcriptional regulator n=1 Tax=Dactylosporangium vinaceum TaxID=53362 RepID=A0ABV5MDH8_9ACTN|nr:GntR family transcriptional regulator [Dactylosporangium vinaceum]UAC00776.1 GntR family transcriptional regulator [Dactylosporangium vinaceum]
MELDKDGTSQVRFVLDPGSGVPTYLQLVHQVEQAMRLGVLRDGDRLPRIKDVVETLAINPNTVQKAYRELTARGIASGQQGVGTFVRGSLPVVDLAGQAALRRRLVTWVRAARDAGLDHGGISALVASVLHEESTAAPVSPGRRENMGAA